MKFNRTTKSALFTSVVSLFLCFTMLLGTTFAWFTDSATSTGNVIKTGTLDILFQEYDEENSKWVDVEGSLFDYDKWEPGYTQVANLRVVNNGSLALKWQATITTENDLSILADAINVYVRSDDANDSVKILGDERFDFAAAVAAGTMKKFTLRQFINNLTVMTQGTMQPEQESYLTIALQMDPDAGNEYQGLDLGGKFDLTILATQYTAESDSFNNQYDKDATYYITSDAVDVTTTPTEDVVLTSKSVNNAVKVVLDTAAVNNLPDEVTKVSLSHSEPVVDEANASISFEVVELVDQNNNPVDLTGNDAPIEVTLPAQSVFAPGSLVNIYHDGELIDKAIVNADTTITYVAYHFCEVTIDAVPVAIVNDLGNKTITNIDGEEITLDCGYQFLPFHETADEAIASGYAGWHADFVVTVNKDVESVGAAGLAGYYSAWCELVDHKWVTIPMDGTKLVANEEFRLVSAMGLTVNYEEICTYSFAEGNLHDGFLCGAYADESMSGVTLNVELRLYEVGAQGECEVGGGCTHPHVECETGEYIVIGQYSHTFD